MGGTETGTKVRGASSGQATQERTSETIKAASITNEMRASQKNLINQSVTKIKSQDSTTIVSDTQEIGNDLARSFSKKLASKNLKLTQGKSDDVAIVISGNDQINNDKTVKQGQPAINTDTNSTSVETIDNEQVIRDLEVKINERLTNTKDLNGLNELLFNPDKSALFSQFAENEGNGGVKLVHAMKAVMESNMPQDEKMAAIGKANDSFMYKNGPKNSNLYLNAELNYALMQGDFTGALKAMDQVIISTKSDLGNLVRKFNSDEKPKSIFTKTERDKIGIELKSLSEYKTNEANTSKVVEDVSLEIDKQLLGFLVGKSDVLGSELISQTINPTKLGKDSVDITGQIYTAVHENTGGLTGNDATTKDVLGIGTNALSTLTGIVETAYSLKDTIGSFNSKEEYSKIAEELTKAANKPGTSDEKKLILLKYAEEAKNISTLNQNDFVTGFAKTGINVITTGISAAGTVSALTSIADVSVKATADTVGGALGGIGGGISIIMGTIGIIKDSHSAILSSNLNKKALAFQENPPKALYELFSTNLEKFPQRIKQLNYVISKTTNTDKIALMKSQISELEADINKCKEKLPELKKDAELFKTSNLVQKGLLRQKYGVSEDLDAISSQTVSRTGKDNKIFKGLSITNNVISMFAGGLSTTGTILAATGYGAAGSILCPIGWTLSGASAVGTLGLGTYKMGKTIQRSIISGDLEKQDKEVTNIIGNIKKQLTTENAKTTPDDNKIIKLEKDLKKAEKVQDDIAIQRNRQDPKFAIDTLLATLNKKVPSDPPEQKKAVENEIEIVKFMLTNVYDVNPEYLTDIPKYMDSKTRESAEKVQKNELKKLENKINYFG